MAREDEAGWDDLQEVIVEKHRSIPQKELLKPDTRWPGPGWR
jgi:hypothetical protein